MSSDLSPGSVFAERYRIERRIATGGMGAVYEVVHLETNRRRALKVLHANLVQSDELRERFRREARVAAEIESEYIVDVFDAGIDAKTEMPFLVMELLRGEDLRSRVKRLGPLSPQETVEYLFQAALALDKTHAARIIHRDLKPDNLFLCEREHGPPRVKVLDFGIAKIIADGAMNGQTTEALGTPLYMAPEQFLMSSRLSPATDIFALGLIAYAVLVGKPYWYDESTNAGAAIVFALHASRGPQESAIARASRVGVQLPSTFDPWFFRVTAAKPDERFPSATAAIAELAQALGVPMALEAPPASLGAAALRRSFSLAPSSGSGITGPLMTPASATTTNSTSPSSLRAVQTPIESDVSTTASPKRKIPMAALVVGAAVALIVGLLIVIKSSSGPGDEPDPASPALALPSAALAPSSAQTMATLTPDAPAAPAQSASAVATPSSKPVFKLPAPRPTGSSVKKPGGGVMWNND